MEAVQSMLLLANTQSPCVIRLQLYISHLFDLPCKHLLHLSQDKQLPDHYYGLEITNKTSTGVGLPFASIYPSAKGIKYVYPSAWTNSPVLVPEDHPISSADECKLPADGPQSISWIWLFLSWLDGAWVRQCMVERAASHERWK